ncbi:MAG: ATP-binding protein [Anaerolineae bacterium]
MARNDEATILYIEDDFASRRLVRRVLTNRGYKVLLASDGLEGIALAREQRPQLILMDINLPNLDGREITTRLRGLPHLSKTPIVALTANNTPGSRELALAAGCSGFLSKPIDVSCFPQQVDDFLNGRLDPLTDEERSHNLAVHAQNVAERLEDKVRQLEHVNQRLRELDGLKSDFILLVSHELRTPLTLISGYAHLLEEKLQPAKISGEPPEIDALATIASGLNAGINRMNEVVNEIINVSRISSGKLDLSLGPVRLSDLMQEVAAEFDRVYHERSLHLHMGRLDHLPLIEADGRQLKKAISNVLGNAVKYTPDGGDIYVIGRKLEDAIDLMIQDTGIGIPPEEQKRIFEQFYVLGAIQHHSSSKSAFKGGGLGLGLAIAKGIIEAHNGRIWVESERRDPEDPPGSTFHLLLPIKQPGRHINL